MNRAYLPNLTSRSLASLFLAFLIGVSPALAREKVQFSTIWMIGDPIDSPQMPKKNAAGTLQVSRGDIFMSSRVLPSTAAQLSGDLLDDKGAIVIPKGTELFGLKSDVPIFCTVIQNAGSKFVGFLVGGQIFSNTCFVDADHNGLFESWFGVTGQVKGLPNYTGTLPNSDRKSVELAYVQIEPQSMRAVYFVGLQYLSNKNLFKNEIFDVVFGSVGNVGSLTERLLIRKKDIPGGLDLLGGNFTLLSSADGSAEIRINRPFSRLAFNVERTVSYKFY